MSELIKCCRVCLQLKSSNVSLYQQVQQKYLPSVIENICGIVVSSLDEPQALICKVCAEAIINADNIIQKCQDSHKILNYQKQNFDGSSIKCKLEEAANWLQTIEGKHDVDANVPHYLLEPEILVEPILESSLQKEATQQQKMANSDIVIPIDSKRTKSHKQNSRFKLKDQPPENPKHDRSEENPDALLYQSHFKTSKPKKPFLRSRDQYLKRKIRNYPVKQPLKLIGGAGVVRKRKPKSYHRAIPNFYFCCELCHEFESNVASYAVAHLNTVHAIERPAIFRCPQCDSKPFIKNQSLQEHIATIHEQQPKKRNFTCQECGKSFIKNCHLQKHLLSVHKIGDVPLKCKISKCGKIFEEAYALRLHMEQSHHDEDEENCESLATLHQCHSCGKSYMDLTSLNNHIKIAHTVEGFNCFQCGYSFREKERYDAHVKRAKCKPPCFLCRYCERTFVKLVELEEHQGKMH